MRLLDLFCGAGGAAMGYHQAGFTHIVGVDNQPQPNYPFDFIQADALTHTDFDAFDLVHASPPCQHFTRYRNAVKDITDRYQDLIEPTLQLLDSSGPPYVVENVPGAPIRADIVLCGSMFGLDVRRHRVFQLSGFGMVLTPPCHHKTWTKRRYKSSSNRANLRYTIEVGAWDEPVERQKQAMGVDWPVTVRELSEAIPPAYTRFIGQQFITQAAHA